MRTTIFVLVLLVAALFYSEGAPYTAALLVGCMLVESFSEWRKERRAIYRDTTNQEVAIVALLLGKSAFKASPEEKREALDRYCAIIERGGFKAIFTEWRLRRIMRAYAAELAQP